MEDCLVQQIFYGEIFGTHTRGSCLAETLRQSSSEPSRSNIAEHDTIRERSFSQESFSNLS